MAKKSEVQQQELASAFRVAHKRADSELSGFSRAFKIRDRMLTNRRPTMTTIPFVRGPWHSNYPSCLLMEAHALAFALEPVRVALVERLTELCDNPNAYKDHNRLVDNLADHVKRRP